MKYIFIIHSHIAFLASISIINNLGLDANQVLFLYKRKYKNIVKHIPYSIYDVNDLFSYNHNILISPIYRRNFIKSIDSLINRLIQEDYEVFLPQLLSYAHQVLVSNHKCKGFHLFQESAKPLFGKSNLQFKHYIRCLLLSFNNRIWAQDDYYIPEKIYRRYRGIVVWSFNSDYYSKLECVEKRSLEFPVIQIDVDYNTNYPFFILEAAIEAGLIEKDVFMDGCDMLVKKYAEKRNYIKFHPGQSDKNREEILAKFEKYSKEVIIIDDGIPFELVIAKYKELKIIGFTSSLLFFAQDAGHHVISKGDYLTERSKKYRRFINRLG